MQDFSASVLRKKPKKNPTTFIHCLNFLHFLFLHILLEQVWRIKYFMWWVAKNCTVLCQQEHFWKIMVTLNVRFKLRLNAVWARTKACPFRKSSLILVWVSEEMKKIKTVRKNGCDFLTPYWRLKISLRRSNNVVLKANGWLDWRWAEDNPFSVVE